MQNIISKTVENETSIAKKLLIQPKMVLREVPKISAVRWLGPLQERRCGTGHDSLKRFAACRAARCAATCSSQISNFRNLGWRPRFTADESEKASAHEVQANEVRQCVDCAHDLPAVVE